MNSRRLIQLPRRRGRARSAEFRGRVPSHENQDALRLPRRRLGSLERPCHLDRDALSARPEVACRYWTGRVALRETARLRIVPQVREEGKGVPARQPGSRGALAAARISLRSGPQAGRLPLVRDGRRPCKAFTFSKSISPKNYELQAILCGRHVTACHTINYSVRNDSPGRRKMKQLVPARSRPSLMDYSISSALG
jgi:hypothetical protein